MAEDHAYWFLYKGTPGGTFEPARQYYGTDKGRADGDPLDYYVGEKRFDQWRWAYFDHQESNRVLYLAQLHPDVLSDTFAYLGNSEKDIDSEDGMVVFGFGRAERAQPLLSNPNTFLLGFYEQPIYTPRAHRQFAKN